MIRSLIRIMVIIGFLCCSVMRSLDGAVVNTHEVAARGSKGDVDVGARMREAVRGDVCRLLGVGSRSLRKTFARKTKQDGKLSSRTPPFCTAAKSSAPLHIEPGEPPEPGFPRSNV
ncbi:hypothetical protein NDU88_003995 [Pleurodeles waltl]|uniref:Secreted protein n=1 Tax=Pleurodeles waltl TaxID=8319 RepID=A0AAV7UEV8_PLEWA|nr:hypothetical protein NDU88_003995 [Pleurodeles waltl]